MSNFAIINISHQNPLQRFPLNKTPHISIYLCDSPDFSSGGNFVRYKKSLPTVLHFAQKKKAPFPRLIGTDR